MKDSSPLIAIVDYGAGNLHSVTRAVEKAGGTPLITDVPEDLAKADGIILPGVGSAKSAMDFLAEKHIDQEILNQVDQGKPLFGICLGMQLLFGENEEGPTKGLGILPGRVALLRGRTKVPHMGWNSLNIIRQNPLLEGVEEGSYVYFVHSYHVVVDQELDIVSTTDYEGAIVSTVARGNVLGTQFHPEKSSDIGIHMYENFMRIVRGEVPIT